MDIDFRKRVPVVHESGVVVAGGGIAGVCAALAAARDGADVLLIERFGQPGGIATVGGVNAFCGDTRGQGEAFDEIVRGLESFDAIEPYVPIATRETRCFNAEILGYLLMELLRRRGVRLLLHARVADGVLRDGRLSHVLLAGPAGLEAAGGKVFIDCTGEATLTRAAGLPVQEAGQVMPPGLMCFLRELISGDPPQTLPDEWVAPIADPSRVPGMSRWKNGPRSCILKLNCPGADCGESRAATDAELSARRRMMEIVKYRIQREGRPWMFDRFASMLAPREGRRVRGDYVLTGDDLRRGARFDDGVARGVFRLDDPSPASAPPPGEGKVPPYHIPLRSLIVRDCDNLLAAGRCFSGDRLALSSARVMTTCAMMGQAAGIAAGLALPVDGRVREVDPRRVVEEVVRRGGDLSLERRD